MKKVIRDGYIIKAYWHGAKRSRIAKAFNLSYPRVCSIIKRSMK